MSEEAQKKGRNVQKFPSGEVRIFEAPATDEGEPVEPMRLVSHVRAPGDPSTDDLTGTAIDAMPAPWAPPVNVEGAEHE